MGYRHRWIDGSEVGLPAGKAVCVGRNYVEHAKEMGHPVPEQPMLFIKPETALVALDEPVRLPAHGADIHHELELAVLIGTELAKADRKAVGNAVAGYALAIDLTARDLQAELKKKGHPWEIAKGFDGACPVSTFVRASEISDPQNVSIRLQVNGEIRQAGSTRDMVTSIMDLIGYSSRFFTLRPGDLVLTGTPAGVGALHPGDRLRLELDGRFSFDATVARS